MPPNQVLGLLLPILLLAAIFLAGCTAPDVSPTSTPTGAVIVPPSPQPAATQPPAATLDTECSEIVRLKLDDWSNTDEAQAARDEVLAAFHAAYPCIDAEIVPQEEVCDANRLNKSKRQRLT
jgi:hypothetical protein